MELLGPFIEQKIPDFDEGWAWNKALGRVQSERPEPSESIQNRTILFRKRIQTYLTRHADNETRAVFHTARTWDDIQKEVAEAVEKHNKDGHTWRQPFSKSRRVFGNVACRLEFLIELLPRGDYTSILSGGLTLVFNAAKRIKLLRATILRTFDSLGENIDNTKAYIRIYSRDQELQDRAEDLYVAILEAVEAIVTWLENHPLRESFKSFFQQSQYGQVLAEKTTNNIQAKAAAFDNRVRTCLHSTVQEVNNGVIQVGKQVIELRKQLHNGLHGMGEFAAGIKEEFERKSSIENVLLDLVKGCEWIKEMQELSMQKQSLLQAQVEQMSHQPQVQVVVTYVPQPLLSVEKLLEILITPPNLLPSQWSVSHIVHGDSETVLSLTAHGLSPVQQERLAVMMQEPKFRSWFKTSQSSILVANSLDYSSDPVSSMSFMCGLLSSTISQLGFQAPLTFYCSLHSAPGDVFDGANGLLRSLISQLLVSYGAMVHVTFLNNLEDVESLKRHDLRALCRLFQNLLACLDQGVVFCLIDSVSWLETPSLQADMDVVMYFLRDLTTEIAESGSRVIFKLLVTTAATGWGCRRWFPGADEVFLSEDDYVDGRGSTADDINLHAAALY